MSKDGNSTTAVSPSRKSRSARQTVVPGDEAGAAELGRRVADNLRERRRVSHLSLDELAKLSGVSRAALSQIETCKTNPSLSVLWKVASGLVLPG
jgi:DNA-binding XRE family transcriptional regulator